MFKTFVSLLSGHVLWFSHNLIKKNFDKVNSKWKWNWEETVLITKSSSTFFPHDATAPSGPGPPHFRGFTITLRHTTLGRTPLDEWSARRKELYLTTHNRQTYTLPAGFKTKLPASERQQIHALDRTVAGICSCTSNCHGLYIL